MSAAPLSVPKILSKREIGNSKRATSWSRTKYLNPINALSGVAYGIGSVISPLLVVRNLSLDQASAKITKCTAQESEILPKVLRWSAARRHSHQHA